MRPSHWRYLRAKMHCLEAGLPPTTVNVSKHCGISRVALWKLRVRWPWLDAWCDEILRESNAHYWGAIERRMALTALQGGGSVAHAEQFCKMRANEGEGGSVANAQVIMNFLVPRPAMPTLTAVKAVEAASVLTLTAPAVPVLKVRT